MRKFKRLEWKLSAQKINKTRIQTDRQAVGTTTNECVKEKRDRNKMNEANTKTNLPRNGTAIIQAKRSEKRSKNNTNQLQAARQCTNKPKIVRT
jgi:Arc/MetJ family transcription regulator